MLGQNIIIGNMLPFQEMEFPRRKSFIKNLNILEINSTVKAGSVVVSDDKTFFISVGLGQISLDGKTVFAISLKSPIFQAFGNKTVGEKFVFRDLQSQIVDIY